MPSISYAQNFEDVMLRRALSDVETGTYIDVGAHDPTEFSVTKLFYELGWHGINVEPVKVHFEDLERDRPRDLNLNCAAGAAAGSIPLYVIPGTGLSTFIEAHALEAAERGYLSMPTIVPVETLDQICARLTEPVAHFLKIDVEGAEADVLRGMSFTSVRPWIVVVEATRPGTAEPAFDNWEPLLLERAYAFAYFDGLNRFYVANEQSKRRDAFHVPPNVFDEFVPARQHVLEVEAVELEARAMRLTEESASARDALLSLAEQSDSLRRERDHLERRSEGLQADLARLQSSHETLTHDYARLAEIRLALDSALIDSHARSAEFQHSYEALKSDFLAFHRSRSWRYTAPLRALMRWIRPLLRRSSVTSND